MVIAILTALLFSCAESGTKSTDTPSELATISVDIFNPPKGLKVITGLEVPENSKEPVAIFFENPSPSSNELGIDWAVIGKLSIANSSGVRELQLFNGNDVVLFTENGAWYEAGKLEDFVTLISEMISKK